MVDADHQRSCALLFLLSSLSRRSGISDNEAVDASSIDWSVLTVKRLHRLHGCPQLIISSSYT